MLKKIRLSIIAIFCAGVAYAQSGSLIITVLDSTKKAVPFAGVQVTKGGVPVGGGSTDFDGRIEVKPLDPGQYDVQATLLGYQTISLTGVNVAPDAPTHITVNMKGNSGGGVQLHILHVIYEAPAVNPDHTGTILQGKDIHNQAVDGGGGGIKDVIATTPGFYQADLGKDINARGSRSDANQYIVDGVKLTADQALGGIPKNMIDQVNTYTGGVPAKYGDATGGVIEINTTGASPKFFGTVDASTSEGLDAFGYNDANFVIGGPIWSKKDSTGAKIPKVDFILGGEFTYKKDQSPSFTGGYYADPSVLSQIQATPLLPSSSGGFVSATDYVTDADIVHSAYRYNNASNELQGNGKLDFRINNNVTLTAGGSYDYSSSNYFEYVYEMFNYSENPLHLNTSWRGFVRLRQRFATSEGKDKKAALIQNAYYTLQAEYGNTYEVYENNQFKDNYFDYGYVGQFNQYQGKAYQFENGKYGYANYQVGFTDSLYTFNPSTSTNPLEANYTSDVYNNLGAKNITNPNTVQENYGLLNGQRPQDVYSLWYNTGRAYPGYSKQNSNHFRFTANFSATIKNNDVQIGFEYEQNVISYYSITAASLWSIMQQNTNLQISQLDTAHPYLVSSGGYNTYGYNRLYNANVQTQFDKSLRQSLGLPINGTQWLDPDSYSPSMYSLNMFSASDLLNNGNQIVTYYGYDYKGNAYSSTPSIDDFFNERDANGNLVYPVAPYHPIYMAGYIQDHFDIKNLRFDVGVRVDRFDANEPVLKDPYLFFPAKTVAEVRGTSLGENIPSSVNNNDVVYVNNSQSPTQVVGYRNGSTWYDANGNEIADPTVLAAATTTGGIQPYLENPSQTTVSSNAFTQYTPQVNVMPRIAFSFPISDMAGFFAHYDILTQRPPGIGYNLFVPTQYLYILSNVSGVLNNPALKPTQTTDYELGFTQALNEKKTTALTISAFYREFKNNIETYRYLDAYPVSYLAYSNLDFGTIKGLTVAYTLTRVGNIKMRASYTLQFATGTGSGPSSGYNLANSGQPNLQIPMPLDFDQRHTFLLNIDYHYGAGEGNYDGPIIKTHGGKSLEILSNAGLNVNFTAGSGTPYTEQANATEGDPNSQNVGIGIAQHYSLVGSVNGDYLPWQFRVDLKADKDFPLTIKGKDKNSEGHKCDIQVYLQVLNLLNTENILNVYHYTGSPTDDGYLASASGQQAISEQVSPQAFIDQYKIKEQDPTYLSLPRQIRLGVDFNF